MKGKRRLIVTDDLTLTDLRTGATVVVYLTGLTFDDAADLVNASLYGAEDDRRHVADAVAEQQVCDILNDTRAFGMAFVGGDLSKVRPHEDDVVLLVQRPFGELLFTRVDVEANFTVVETTGRDVEDQLATDLLQ
jgi:hypothetical protein